MHPVFLMTHNIIVIGDNDQDMALAVQELDPCAGGYTIVADHKVVGDPSPSCYGPDERCRI